MSWSWSLGKPFGIPTKVHLSFVLLLAWVALSSWFSVPSLLSVGLSLAFTVAIFATVVLHELGHALTARAFGIQTRSIVLLPIGGVANLERAPETPKQELLIAAAGPAVNVAIAGLGGLAYLGLSALGAGAIGMQFLLAFVVANVILAAFNMLPAFPLDGGRVFRAAVERKKGRVRATEVAAKLGGWFALAFAVFGLFGGNPMLFLIAPFVWFAGRRELMAVRRQAQVEEMQAARKRAAWNRGGVVMRSAPGQNPWLSGQYRSPSVSGFWAR